MIIYMPMVSVAALSMLACARIGAIHSVVFGGYAAKELAQRFDDLQPKLIITCSAGIEPSKVIKYAPIIDQALSLTTAIKNKDSFPRLIYQRPESNGKYADQSLQSRSDVYFDYAQIM